MIETLFQFLHEYVIPLGWIGVFLACFAEEFFAPIPSAVILYTAGYLFLTDLSGASFIFTLIFVITIPAAAGVTLGSYLVYGLGYKLGRPFFEKWGKWLGAPWEKIEKTRERLSRGVKDEVVLGVLRMLPPIPTVLLSAAAGIVRMNIVSYTVATFLGIIPRVIFLALIGWKVGDVYDKYGDQFSWLQEYVVGGIIVLIVGFIIFRIIKHHQKA